MSLIQPALKKVLNQANKVVCINQKKQAYLGIALGYAQDHSDRLPDMKIVVPWWGNSLMASELASYYGNPGVLDCPNFQITERLVNNTPPDTPINIGSVYLAHRNQKGPGGNYINTGLSDTDDVDIYGKRWYSPETLSDDPSYTLLACRAEEAGPGSPWKTILPHTDESEDYTFFDNGTTVHLAGWLGASAVYLDGSANWIEPSLQDWHITNGGMSKFYYPSTR